MTESRSEPRDLTCSPLHDSSLLEQAQALAGIGSWAAEHGGPIVWSNACRQIIGLADDEQLTLAAFLNRVHPDDRGRVEAELARLADGVNAEHETDYRIVRPDGTVRWLRARVCAERDPAHGNLRLVGVLQDITWHKQALAELRASEERYRGIAAIVEWSSDAIIGCDLSGAITSWNRGATRLCGYLEREVLKRPIELIIPENLRAEAAALRARVRAAEVLEQHVTVWRRKDGSEVEVSLTMTPLRDASGKVVGLSKVARDLTDQRHAERALRHAEQQLRDAQKMEAVGLLAGGIAHDFNNMLSAIVGYTELVLDGLPPDDPIRADILEVRKAGASAVSLTRQLLAFSRRQVLSPRVINLNQIVTHLEQMVRRLSGAHVVLSFELDAALGRVSADPGQIEQVIINLVLNARDAMVDGGTLTISTGNTELTGSRADALQVKPGPYVTLAIADTGCGIDSATRARVFEPFFTTKEKGKGTGLGLSTALGIVQQSGGAIELYSELGAGTTVRVYLPRTEQPVQSAYSVPPARSTLRSWETILLVEDDEQVRSLARTALRRQGFQVLEAEQGEQALAVCAQHKGRIHLLLTDVVMPRMGGRELAARAAALRPDMKVLFMSGYANDEILPSGVLDDTIALLQKPITPSSVTRRVREVLDAG